LSDDGLVFCVQRSSGFVHQQDGRLLDQGPGNRNALAFATGKACTVFAHHRLHPVWQSRNDFIKPGLLRWRPGRSQSLPRPADPLDELAEDLCYMAGWSPWLDLRFLLLWLVGRR
jgi:hypothetical protein